MSKQQLMIEIEGNQALSEQAIRETLTELFLRGIITRVKMGEIQNTPVRFALPVEVTKP